MSHSARKGKRSTGRARENEVVNRAAKRAQKSNEKHSAAETLKEEGNTFFRQGKFDVAASKYRQAAVALGPRSVYMSNLAAALLKLGFHQQAESAASRALFYEPRHLKARYRRGLAAQARGDHVAAAQDFMSVLRQDPLCDEARIALSEMSEMSEMSEDMSAEADFGGVEDEDAMWEIRTESDSSEFQQEGNGIPCRYLNHDGCRHGSDCWFKHGPDSYSQRDELGRNACILWLLGLCKRKKCYYAHDKTYLPRNGWWNRPGQVKYLRELATSVDASYYSRHSRTEVRQMFMSAMAATKNWCNDLWMAGDFGEEDRLLNVLVNEGEEDAVELERSFVSRYMKAISEANPILYMETLCELGIHEAEIEERVDNMGFLSSEVEELLCQGVKPWDDDAWDVLHAL